MQNQDGPPPRHLHPVDPPHDQDPPYDPHYEQAYATDRTPAGNDRTPPHDDAAERALLATLITNPELGDRLHNQVEAHDFYRPTHETIWTTWHHLHGTDGVPPDLVTLNSTLIQHRHAEAARTLVDLATADANPLLADSYATIVRDKARLRVVDHLATQLRDYVTRGRISDVQPFLEESLQRLDETVVRFGPTTRNPALVAGLRDLNWILTGQAPQTPEPTWVRRTDGTALFYAGLVNGVFGDPESAKTWLAQIAVVEALDAGQSAAMIDVDHNGPNHTAARLLLLGARPEHLADPDRFRYYEPEDGEELRAAVDDVVARRPAVVLIDSLGEIFPMLGVKTNEGDELTAALRLVCARPAAAGSCVITIDHLPKGTEARATGFAIGSIAKKRMIRGSYLRVEARTQPAPGAIGRITLRIEKDTNGSLRRSSGGGYAGTFTLDSTAEHVTTWTIGRDETPKNDDGTFRPTHVMEKVSRYVESNDQCSVTDLRRGVGGKAKVVDTAVAILLDEGFLTTLPGARNSTLHHAAVNYREDEDEHAS